MKKLLIISVISLLAFSANAQLFSGTKTLEKGEISLGFHPTIIDGDAGVYLRGTIGTAYDMDVNLNIGILDGDNFVGVDVKKPLYTEYIDIAVKVGAHFYGDKFGLDGSIIGGVDLNEDITFFSGLDADLYGDDGLKIDFWLPIGVEYHFYPKMTFIGELNLGINERAYNIWQAGIRFYF